MITGLLHASLLVADLTQARAFYEGILGLTADPNRPDLGYPGAWYTLGAQNNLLQIHLMQLPNPETGLESVDNHVARCVARPLGMNARRRAQAMAIPLASPTTRQAPQRTAILRKRGNRAHCRVARSLFGITKLRRSRLALHPDSPRSHSSHDCQQTLTRPEHGGRDRHIALAVDNLAALEQRLSSAGVAYTLSRSGRRALFCRDPDQNALEFVEGALENNSIRKTTDH